MCPKSTCLIYYKKKNYVLHKYMCEKIMSYMRICASFNEYCTTCALRAHINTTHIYTCGDSDNDIVGMKRRGGRSVHYQRSEDVAEE